MELSLIPTNHPLSWPHIYLFTHPYESTHQHTLTDIYIDDFVND